jgi:hypothetical protein
VSEWTGPEDHQFSLRLRVALHVELTGGGWVWCITEPWTIGQIPDRAHRKSFTVEGLCSTMDEAKRAAETMAVRVLKRRRSCR